MSEKCLLVVDSHPIQYRAPLYREIHRFLSERDMRLRVIYASDSSVRGALDAEFGQTVTWDEPLLEGYDSEFLPDAASVSPGGFRALGGRGIEAAIARIRPAAVLLNGLNYVLFVRALAAGRLRGIPVWLRSETQDRAFARGRWKSLVRGAIYRGAYSQFDHVFPIGRLNAQHYAAHGIPAARMTFAHYCVVDRFRGPAVELEERGRRLRRELGFSEEQTVILFCGKLISKKTPKVLLDAVATMTPAERGRYGLLYVGTGSQETELREQAGELGAHAVFAGFINQSVISDYYLASDALILPSQKMGETWGLVANESLLAGRPVILSPHAGSSVDFADFSGVQVVEPQALAVAESFRRVSSLPRGAILREQMEPYSMEAAASAIAGHFANLCAAE